MITTRPKLRSFILKRLFTVIGLAAIILMSFGEWYARSSASSKELAKLDATLHAFSTSIKSDLEAGDFFSLRKVLESGLRNKQYTQITIVDLQSGEEIIRIPYALASNSALGNLRADGVIKGNDGYSSWKIELAGDENAIYARLSNFRVSSLAAIFAVLIAIAFLSWVTSQTLAANIFELQRVLESMSGTSADHIPTFTAKVSVYEAEVALKAAERTATALSQTMKTNESLAAEAAVGQIAAQVAHDIRSPLSALNMLLHSMPADTEQSQLMKLAINRIAEVATGLLSQSRAKDTHASRTPEVQLVSTLLKMAVQEKTLELGSSSKLTIAIDLLENRYGASIAVVESDFRSIISNLLNNCAEAGATEASVKLECSDGEIRIRINDNGCGISDEVLPRLFQKNFTHGKTDGHGLGLHHARKVIESWKGQITIHSKAGKGAEVAITFPRAESPSWLARGLEVESSSRIILVDDDQSVPATWRSYLAKKGVKLETIEFNSLKTFETWSPRNLRKTDLILMDQQFSNESDTGLNMIERLNLRHQAVLISSVAEQTEVRSRLIAKGIRAIPKSQIASMELPLIRR